jgi:glucose/arabinose dehydrogenase
MIAVIVASLTVAVLDSKITQAEAAPVAGFQDTTVISNLTMPTKVRFAPDGRVFVAEKSGIIKVYASLSATAPTVFADLRTQVYNWWDHGLLSLAIDPNWPASPYIYVSYSYDALPSSPNTFPHYGSPGQDSDPCPYGGNSVTNGCPSLGRISRLTANSAGTASIGETVLVQDYCGEFASHSVGDLQFAPDGSLLATGGEGANYTTVDLGSLATPPNPCGDPADSGGALRSQQIRSQQLTKPVALGGSLIRIDKMTGAGLAGNPLSSSSDANARRLDAHGLRNPFRFALRPGTDEVWLGDVGWSTSEEINRLPHASGSPLTNFGWPCYEGTTLPNGYSATSSCQSLYATPTAVTNAWFHYEHGSPIRANESCGFADSSITGLAFYNGGAYPSRYQGALFFADYSRRCIWAFLPGSDGAPDPSKVELFVGNAASPVDLEIGPAGDLFYVDLVEGEVHRVSSTSSNQVPRAAIAANTRSGAAPLTVQFDASASSDPNAGDTLQYAWDFEGDGRFADATSATPSHAFTNNGVYLARVRVTDPSGASAIATTIINVGGGALAPPGQAGWQANGAAAPGTCTQLTGPVADQTGSIVWTTPINASAITASFDAIIGSGTAGDGLAFAFLDPSATSAALGVGGDQLGFGGLPGVAVTLDTAMGVGEPSANFVGIATSAAGGAISYQRTSTSIGALRGRTVHVDVVSAARAVRVFVDGSEVLNEQVALPPSVLLAFAAATGPGTSDRHQVCNVQLSTASSAPGRLVATPTTVAFGSVPAGGDAPASITLENTGIGPATIGAVALPNAPFVVDNPLVVGSIVAAGTIVTQQIRFRPDAAGAASSSYSLDAGGSGSASVALGGTGATSTIPRATVTSPSPTSRWKPGDAIAFTGTGTTSAGAALPASAFSWTIVVQHCATPSSCHAHTIQTYSGVAGGSFVAPDHGYPSYLDIQLTVTSGGQSSTRSVRIEPMTTTLTFDTVPSGLSLVVDAGSASRPTPFTITATVGSTVYVSAPSTQTVGTNSFAFSSWSQGGAATQSVVVPATPASFVASYVPVSCSGAGVEVPIATNGSGPVAPPAGVSGYQALTPTRLFDTRLGQAAVCNGETLVARVAGRAGVPSTGVSAVALNLTVTQARAAGYVTVWPSNSPRPNASSLNFAAGDTNANMVIVPLGATGAVSLRNADDSTAMLPVQLLADVVGYFPTGSGFTGLNPTRVLDTRSGVGSAIGPMLPGATIDLSLTGRGGIPGSGVDAVVMNLTVTDAVRDGYITSWPAGASRPNASSVNFSAQQTTPNLVLAKVSSDGRVSLWNSSDTPAMGSVQLLADVTGWFPTGSSFHSLTPQRILDTRNAIGSPRNPIAAGGQLDLRVTGSGGVPATGVSAVVLNLTATNMRAPGYVTTWPTNQARPNASSLNFATRNVANLVIARVSPDGKVSLWNANDTPAMGSVDLVADVVGWFAA